MEIHELNTFSGTLGAGDFFATDNGSDTSKVSADSMFAPLNARIDNIIAGGDAPSAAEVTDARLGATVLGGEQFVSLGEAIRGQAITLFDNLSNITNALPIDNWVKGKYINTGTNPVNINSPTSSASYNYVVVSCSAHDIFVITGVGGSGAKLWCFIDGSGNRITVSDSDANLSNVALIAPTGAVYLVVNVKNASPYSLYKDKGGQEYFRTLQASVVSDQIKYNSIYTEAVTHNFYYNNATGFKQMAGTYSCSETLLPYNSDFDRFALSTGSLKVFITCYDKNKDFIVGAEAPVAGAVATPKVIPKTTKFIGLSVNSVSATEIGIRLVDKIKNIEYPFTDPNCFTVANRFMNNTGAFSSENSSYECIFFLVEGGSEIYTNVTLASNMCCYTASNAVVTPTYVEINRHGRVYTMPNDAVMCCANLNLGNQHGGVCCNVYNVITKPEKILCIGDSITWLDGTTDTSHDGASLFNGYQKQIQKEGYKVISAGYSGYAYAKDGEHNSIYTAIVESEYDVSDYDVIILSGGTNDDLYGITIGTAPTSYSDTAFDETTTLGALSAIIAYIRANNSNCKIILCTQLKSQAASRPYSEAVQYADGFKNVAKFASCYLCDLFENMNVQPYTNGFAEFYYDGTHPNKAGMVRVGQLILKAIENA